MEVKAVEKSAVSFEDAAEEHRLVRTMREGDR